MGFNLHITGKTAIIIWLSGREIKWGDLTGDRASPVVPNTFAEWEHILSQICFANSDLKII